MKTRKETLPRSESVKALWFCLYRFSERRGPAGCAARLDVKTDKGRGREWLFDSLQTAEAVCRETLTRGALWRATAEFGPSTEEGNDFNNCHNFGAAPLPFFENSPYVLAALRAA